MTLIGVDDLMRLESTPEAQVRTLIAAKGQITFAEFMEWSLYHPNGGFYSTGGGVGPDFFTSPAAHPAFGALIATQSFVPCGRRWTDRRPCT